MMPQPTLTLSQLITRAQALLAEHGDVPVWIDDADTGWPLGVKTVGYDPVGEVGVETEGALAGVYIRGTYLREEEQS